MSAEAHKTNSQVGELPSDQSVVMQRIGELIRTQNNRATSYPLFIVQEKKRIYGMSLDYCEDSIWVHCDGEEASEDEAFELETKCDLGEVPGEWSKVGFIDTWEFVTACFTEQGCIDFIAVHGHNLRQPRIYAASMYRNREMIELRDVLKSA